jgi:precorrin-6x reductase
MNEQIKDLAKRSGIGFVTPREDLLNDFAELIINQCIAACDETQAAYLKHRKTAYDSHDKVIYAEGEAACDVIKYRIKQHFGVKR